jgi:hypothetical protein
MPPAALPSYVVDPLDPRAPPAELWDRMTPEERERVVVTLPVISHKEDLERLLAEERAAHEEDRVALEAARTAREEERVARESLEVKLAEALAEIARLEGTPS